jgi:hypothetical protein
LPELFEVFPGQAGLDLAELGVAERGPVIDLGLNGCRGVGPDDAADRLGRGLGRGFGVLAVVFGVDRCFLVVGFFLGAAILAGLEAAAFFLVVFLATFLDAALVVFFRAAFLVVFFLVVFLATDHSIGLSRGVLFQARCPLEWTRPGV